MMTLGLSKADRNLYDRAMRESRAMYTEARILDRNEAEIASLKGLVLEGQVTVDAGADITRSLAMTIIDPTNRFTLRAGAPRATLFPGALIRVIRWDYVAALGRFVACPVFWGPLATFERDGNLVNMTAVGKEMYHLAPRLVWESFTLRKGTKTVDAIRTILSKNGETRFQFPVPRSRDRLAKDLSLTRHSEGWLVAQRLARSLGYQLFYDGLGQATLRARPTGAVIDAYTYERAGKSKPVVIGEPKIAFDWQEMRNTAEVLGPKPSGGKKQIRAVAYPHSANPLHPSQLAWHGQAQHVVDSFENADLKTQAQATAVAASRLAARVNLSLAVRFDCLPQPRIEEDDGIHLYLEDDHHLIRARQFTIPLTADAPMSVGSTKRPRPTSRGRVRTKRKAGR